MMHRTSSLPNNWKSTTLGEVATIQTGPFGSQLHNSDYVEKGTPIITVENLIDDAITHTQDTPKVSEEDLNRLKKYSLKSGDIVFSRVGSVDRCGFVSEREDGWLFSGRLLRVRPFSNQSANFLFYWLSQETIKQFVRKIAVGATMPSINTSLLSQIPVTLPPISEQNSIAAILSSVDKKVKLLKEQNKTLEQTAQTIFKEWFVNFNFPENKGDTVDSELGKIPRGWKVGKLIELGGVITDYVANGSFASLKENVTLYNTPNYALFLRNTDLKSNFAQKVFVDEHSYNFLKKTQMHGGEIIISNVGDIGSVYLCPFLNIPMVLGNNTISLRSEYQAYFYSLFTNRLGQFFINSITGGSAQPKFNKTDFRNMKMVIPSENVLKSFESVAWPLYSKILKNNAHIQSISDLRDSLLPKLMKGEIRVQGFDN